MVSFLGALQTQAFSDLDENDPPELTGTLHGQWCRNAPRAGSAARAWHGAIVETTCKELFHDAERLLFEGSHTFWIDASASPRCALERWALEVLRFHALPSCCDGRPVLGAEWWVQVRRSESTDASIGLHWDTDEDLKSLTGEHVPPFLATVTYLTSCGAPTLVLPVAADAHGGAVGGGAAGDSGAAGGGAAGVGDVAGCGAFVSYPRAGKHLAFDGRLLHGAPHALAAPTSSAYRRATLLVNVWAGHRPMGIERLPAAQAQLLSQAQADPPSLTQARPVAAAELPGAFALDEEAVGYPFYHPAVSVGGLPTPPTDAACAAELSLVHIPPGQLELRVGRSTL